MNLHDKKSLAAFQKEAARVLNELAADYGMSAKQHGGTIESGMSAILKFRFTVEGDQKFEEEKKAFEMYAHLYGLEPSDYGMKFTAQGRTFTLVGFNHRRPKFCIKVRDEAGKEMAYSETIVPWIIRQRKAA